MPYPGGVSAMFSCRRQYRWEGVFHDGVGGGVEKGDETDVGQEDQYRQEGPVRNSSL
jgi:hypothetical protein